jgi:diacylglycerol kinase (ATP)
MPRKIIYLINPISGTRGKKTVRELLEKRTREQHIEFEILPTDEQGNYDFLADSIQNDRVTDVVICGGDGTVNAVAAAVRKLPVNIGILPAGSGNGLAFSARIPAQTDRALEIIFRGKSSRVDAFFVNGQFSCMLCGIGLDASVAHAFAKQKRRGLGTYLRISATHFFHAKPFHFELQTAAGKLETEAFFIVIANSNQFGNHFTIAPHASLSDGLLDIVIVKKASWLSLPFAVLRQLSGENHPAYPSGTELKKTIHYFQTDSLVIRNRDLAPMHVDGEPRPTSQHFEIRVIRDCFRLLQP